MNDIRKVMESRSKEDGDWDDWPYPTVTIESVVSGELRARILTVLGYADDGREVRLIESQVSGGYSEYTQEDECSIEVRIGAEVAWKNMFYSEESAMAAFLANFGPA
jgi:hypothetical protein